MQVIRYDQSIKNQALASALEVLAQGGTVVYPTETSYGLGADFFSPDAYRRIYKIKARDAVKPLPVIVPSLNYARTLVSFPADALRLAGAHWPGPLTLVLPFLYAAQLPHHADAYLGLRVSSHPFASDLAKIFGRPVISTSANISGGAQCYSVDALLDQLLECEVQPDLVIDIGTLQESPPSTVAKFENSQMTILRLGSVNPVI